MKASIKTLPILPNNTIERIALSTKFSPEEIDILLQISNATSNPLVCIELLLGIYQERDINPTAKDISNEQNRTFISYDCIKDEVSYSYNRIETKSGYINIGTENPTVEDFITTKGYYEDEIAESVGLTKQEFNSKYVKTTIVTKTFDEIRYSITSLSNWNN